MVGKNTKKNQPDYVFLRAHALAMESIRAYPNPAPRLQFLWLPLDVNSLSSRFQVCFFPNEREL